MGARRRTPALALLTLCTLALALAACGERDEPVGKQDAATTAEPTGTATTAEASGPARESLEVQIASFRFAPGAVRLKAGGSVTWVNRDEAPHTAETNSEDVPARFDTGTLRRGDSKAVRLEEPGSYEYVCGFHLFMTATVEVVE